MAIAKVILNGETLMDVTSDTVATNSMLNGVTATKNDGTKATGNIATKTSSDLTASGATVTVPSGYYASQATKSVSSGSATPASTISATGASVSTGTNTLTLSKNVSNTPQVSAGYVSSGTAGNSSVSLTATVTTNPTPTASGDTVTIPAGYYSAQTTKSVSSGTAGTPTATKGAVSNHSVSVTPSVTNTTGYITGGTKTGTAVTVSASELVSGTKSISANGTGIDVTNFASVDVAVPSSSPTLITKSITANGTYNASSDSADGYSSVTVNVDGGGGGGEPAPKKQINFIDYDGTILHSYTKTEWQSVSTLPSNPSHTGLTAQGWNWTKAQIDAQLTSAPNADIWVGQMYITTSGDTEIDVLFADSARLSPILTIAVNGTITVDWGDNTTADTVTGSSISTRQAVPHTYSSVGDYTITIHVVSGSFQFYGSTTYPLLRKNTTGSENRVYSNCVQAVRLGSGVTSIGSNAFYNCYSLASITIPSGVTSIGSSAFSACYSLASITIPSGVTSIGSNVFSACHSLASITIPSGVTSIGSSAFSSCHSLASITIPSDVTSIESQAFYNCYSLASITIPSDVTSIGSQAFYNCYSLASITIPSGVTSIGSGVFYNCFSLASITIPSDVTSIESNAFSNCYGMAEYHILPTTPPTLGGTNAFSNIVSDCVIYVPSASLSDYQAASNWSTYASYMQGE